MKLNRNDKNQQNTHPGTGSGRGVLPSFVVGTVFGLLVAAGLGWGFLKTSISQIIASPRASVESITQAKDSIPGSSAEQRALNSQIADTLETTQSSSVSIQDLEIQKQLQSIPFSHIKKFYLERLDEDWKKLDARYSKNQGYSEEEVKKRSAESLEVIRRNWNGKEHFISRGEFRLRGGRWTEYVALFRFYSSEDHALDNGQEPEGSILERLQEPASLNYLVSIYLRVDERFLSDGTSNSVGWNRQKGESSYAVFSNYSSPVLTKLYDHLSIPLPLLDPTGRAQGEWYDRVSDRWTSLGPVQWTGITRNEYERERQELDRSMAQEK